MATLVSYALTNLADVKETLGIASSDTSWDNLIIRKINQATEIIEGWCGRRFKQTTYTDELYDATYDNQLVLRNYPISSVTLGARDTTLNEGDFETIDSENYFLNANSGVIDGISTFWGGYDQWSVTYTAGYATIPTDLAEACVTLASYLTVNDPASLVGVASKREGQREIHYFGGQRNVQAQPNESLFAELGILPTLQRYSSPALGSMR